MAEFRTFGRMCRFMIVHFEQPATMAEPHELALLAATAPRRG